MISIFQLLSMQIAINSSHVLTNKYLTVLSTITIHYPLSYTILLQYKYTLPLVTQILPLSAQLNQIFPKRHLSLKFV
jgi:hypothetical protein